MGPHGFQDLPIDACRALRNAPELIRHAVAFRRGQAGLWHVTVAKPSLERYELLALMGCPVFARMLARGSELELQFDENAQQTAARENQRRLLESELAGAAAAGPFPE